MRRRTILVTSLLASVSLLLMVCTVWRDPVFFSDPHAPADQIAYDEILKRPSPDPSRPTNIATLFPVTVNSNSVEIIAPLPIGEEVYDFDLVQGEPGKDLNLGTGILNLQAIGVGYPIGLAPSQLAQRLQVPVRWFNADLTPMSVARQKELMPDPSQSIVEWSGQFPELRLICASSNLGNIQPFGFVAFDLASHKELSTGSGLDHDDQRVWLQTTLQQWHQTSLELFVTLAMDPVQEVIKTPGEKLPLPTSEILLAAMLPGDFGRSTYRVTDDYRSTRLVMQRKKDSSSLHSTLVFGHWPSTQSSTVGRIRAFDDKGSQIDLRYSSGYGRLLVYVAEAPLSQIAEIRIVHYTHVKRIRFVLSEVPGLPAENRSIKNLAL